MSVAYADTSALVAIAFGERGHRALAKRLDGFDEILASNLLEAELRAVFARERIAFEPALIAGITWLLPDAPLSPQIERVLAAGYVRGADLWHLACALYAVESPTELTFVTLDERQHAVAESLGFVL